VNGLNPPAWILVVPAVKLGWNGNGLEHGAPFGPLVILNSEEESIGSVPDHGSIDATDV